MKRINGTLLLGSRRPIERRLKNEIDRWLSEKLKNN